MAQGVKFKNSGVWKSVDEIDGKIQTKVSGTWKNGNLELLVLP